MKTRGAHRVYKRRDVELAVMIRKLLHEEGYTIPGARKRIRELGRADEQDFDEQKQAAVRETNLRADLLAIRAQLVSLLEKIEEDPAPSTLEPSTRYAEKSTQVLADPQRQRNFYHR